MRRRTTLGPALAPFTLAISLTAVVGGCGSHQSAITVQEGTVPVTTESVYLVTALACKNLGSDDARFTPLVVRGPNYATTIQPTDDCRRQPSGPSTSGVSTQGHWYSYVYDVPIPTSGEVRLTPGNQPTAVVDASRFEASHAATIYYVNCSDYYANCPEGREFRGRISSIEYFKDEDARDAP
jgi:hypothetical protein